MELGLKGKVVLITGGSKGIGLACAEAFLAEGARVAIASRGAENLAKAQTHLDRFGGTVATIQADLSRVEDAASMVAAVEAQLGPVDVLVNSAGAARRTLVKDLTAKAWHDAMEAKYFTYIHAMDAVLKGMADRQQGAVVNIIGTGGKVAETTHLTGGAANSALMLATAGLASAYARTGIRINGINPALTYTERLGATIALEATAAGITEAEALQRRTDRIPAGRLAKPEDVANVTLFLASEKASYLIGVIIPMDGGTTPLI